VQVRYEYICPAGLYGHSWRRNGSVRLGYVCKCSRSGAAARVAVMLAAAELPRDDVGGRAGRNSPLRQRQKSSTSSTNAVEQAACVLVIDLRYRQSTLGHGVHSVQTSLARNHRVVCCGKPSLHLALATHVLLRVLHRLTTSSSPLPENLLPLTPSHTRRDMRLLSSTLRT